MTDHDIFLAARDFLIDTREDYDRAYEEFAWPNLSDSFNWANDWFDSIASTDPDSPALQIVEEDGTASGASWGELASRSKQVANFLIASGLRRGDRMLLMLGNQVELWETMLAAMRVGVVVIPATTLLAGDDLADRFERGRVRMTITNATGVEAVSALDPSIRGGAVLVSVAGTDAGEPPEGWVSYTSAADHPPTFDAPEPTSATDPLLEYFTSGTTSKPKLVRHTHVSYPVGHLSTMYWMGLQPGDVHWTISSPGWAKHAWGCFFAPFNAGATVFLYNYTRFDAPTVLDVLVNHGVTSLCAPPTVWRFLIQHDLSDWNVALRELLSAGEPLNPEVIAQVENYWGITIRDGYGQTETTAQIANSPGQPLKPGSMGRPMPGYSIVLLDPDDTAAPDEGEISIALGDRRPVSVMEAYADDEAKTSEVMRAGHYHTGDVAMRDEDGYITYVGRADDVFKASGYRISPFELESVLIEHPAVAEAAVVPSPDELRGYVPKAYVIAADGHAPDEATAAAILSFVREKVPGYKIIRRLEFADLPKTISGKIRRVELRGQEDARDGAGPRTSAEFIEADLRT